MASVKTAFITGITGQDGSYLAGPLVYSKRFAFWTGRINAACIRRPRAGCLAKRRKSPGVGRRRFICSAPALLQAVLGIEQIRYVCESIGNFYTERK